MPRTIEIPPEAIGQRADVFLANQLPEYSRSFWQKQLQAGRVTQNSKPLAAAASLKPGKLQLHLPKRQELTTPVPVLYEDDDVILVNKPAGLLTHAKGPDIEEATLADFIRLHTTDGLDGNRPGIVHRLDRATSGVLIAAKHPEAKRWLQAQFSARKVKKTYLALVGGKLTPPEALIKLPIERNPKKPQTFRVGAGGKTAETAYEVIAQNATHSLVLLYPHTGRTHQLRVHMAHLKHPIVGDELYSGEPAARLFLHAKTLEVTLPSHQRRVFTAPTPPLFEEIEKKLHG